MTQLTLKQILLLETSVFILSAGVQVLTSLLFFKKILNKENGHHMLSSFNKNILHNSVRAKTTALKRKNCRNIRNGIKIGFDFFSF